MGDLVHNTLLSLILQLSVLGALQLCFSLAASAGCMYIPARNVLTTYTCVPQPVTRRTLL